MAQSRSSAGRPPIVLFPRNTSDLTNTTQCPACFTTLTGPVCSRCGLDLTNPAATELAQVSAAAAANLDHRLQLIAQIRAAPVTAPAVSAPASLAEPPAAAAAARSLVPQAPAAPPHIAGLSITPDAAPRRHLGAQVILLIVGVSLLSVGAIFFLVYAFITFGLVWRSMIIAAVTILSIVGASLLRRRRLTATAEAISVLGIVFVYLDIYAVRANDFFGSAAANGLTYWGSCLAVAAIGFVGWHRASGLRIPQIVAVATFGPGIALLVGGVTEALQDSTRAFAAFAALGASALVHPLAVRGASGWLAERRISVMVSGLGLAVAFLLALVIAPESVWAPALALGIVVAIAAGVVGIMSRVGVPRLPTLGIAAIGGVAASVAALAVATRNSDIAVFVFAAPVISAVVTLGLDQLRRWGRGTVLRHSMIVATWASAAVTAAALLPPLTTVLGPVATLVLGGAKRWSIPGGTAIELNAENYTAVFALAVVSVLALAWWLMYRSGRGRVPVILWSASVTLTLAAPLLGQLWLTVIAWLVVAGASLALLTRVRHSSISRRLPFAAATISAAFLAYTSSWASIDTWWFGSVGVVVVLVLVRAATSSVAARSISLAIAVVLAFVAIGSEGWHTNERFQGGADAAIDSLHFVGALAAVLLIVGGVLARRLSRSEGRVVFWIAFAVAVAASALSWLIAALSAGPRALVLGEFGTSVVLGVATIAGLLSWVSLAGTRGFRAERVAAALALAPAFGWLVDSTMRAFDAPDWAQSLAPVSSAVVVSAVSLAVSIVRPGPVPRWARDTGVAFIATVTLAAQVISPSEPTWLIFLMAGVAILIIAVSPDGLVGSHSSRRYLGWLALALATVGLWVRLGHVGVSEVEPYVLPVAGVVLIVALVLQRSTGPAVNAAAAGITLGGLAVAVIPIAVVATTGSAGRAIIITSVAAVLCLLSAIRGPSGLREYQDAAAIVGIAGATIAAFGRARELSFDGAPVSPVVDAWVAVGFAVLAVSAILQSRVTERPALRRASSQILLAGGLVVAAAIELTVIEDDARGTMRAVIVLGALGLVHVLGVTRGKSPATDTVAWLSTGLAVVVAVIAASRGALDPVEWAAAAVAVPLLIAGSVRLAREPRARSWFWLAPGVAALLVLSLAASFSEQPLWRLVGLGVTCVVAIVIGALLRLQAPLMLGAATVLVHAGRTFAPQVIAIYQLTQWWVWAVIGGAILLFIGVTFEKRLRDLRSAGARLSQLR